MAESKCAPAQVFAKRKQQTQEINRGLTCTTISLSCDH